MATTANSPSTPTSLKPLKPEELYFDEKDTSDSGKFKFLLSILKKVIGVGDILNLRISLPSQVLDPIPNLEYFHWLDRPDYFACLSEPDDPVERFIGVLRYSFSRYVKYTKKLAKPYNSVLGEHFLCHWEVNLPNTDRQVTVNMVNEQTSHHPPVSAFWYECPETGVTAQGHDHLSAKFTGTSVKVVPGNLAKGVYINLSKRDNEEYHLTHGAAYIHGFLTGNLGMGLSDKVIVSCPLTGIRAVYEFKSESWIGKNKYLFEGKVFRFKPTFENGTTEADLPPDSFKLSDVSDSELIAKMHGSWRGKAFITRKDSKESELLVDLESLEALPKIVKPQEEMGSLESRNVWQEVTTNILSREFSKATKAKLAIEEQQREKTRQRTENGAPWSPTFFYTKAGEEHRPYLKPNVTPKY
ncbi:hypothetical protein DSO57_1023801 [Entomophthora muscae]|uniref:Uncharacterized protein n=1 Tax=Entomophthora muscae TaxID=34485 RepID=A0ACC2TEU7_9FUNG|nr:hypothetical protein DSO57_1023801 [Entomophthora muscae]